ncbi:MAG TPA: sigma factor-like helix-turn-helix DNA-binding protein [Methylomirabilota bacterium]|nr:sigma factor-like helix-turn-helix DNA-binding protein [Methylomirabilota bacterium]
MSPNSNINPTESNPTETSSGQAGILDKIMGSQTQSSLNEFQPLALVAKLLMELNERDREILTKRFGLDGGEIETLESIGSRFKLTRERVRQIEKDSLNLLNRKTLPERDAALQLLFDTILEHGNVMSEDFLLNTVLVSKSDLKETQAVRFLLNLGEQFKSLKESGDHHPSWHVVGFDLAKLSAIIAQFEQILKEHGSVMSQELLNSKFKSTEYFKQNELEFSDKVLRSYLNIAKSIQINPYSEIGLLSWSDVKPRDVGDKAYLVLKHHGKPEHYSVITKMINDNKFDSRTAFQETVHNELIKDSRFVLIGRGIYALASWGYKRGVVADVIKEIIQSANRPLSREEIIAEVMKRRQVKRNTILVGLSNKKYFMRVAKDKYVLATETKQ